MMTISNDDLKIIATKDDLKAFASKEDLKVFPTKEDLRIALQEYATKEDLKIALQEYATKEDLKIAFQAYATKEDLNRIAIAVARLEGDMHDVKYFLKTDVATKKDLDRIMVFADQVLHELVENRELRSTRGHLLGEVVERVDDHERRLRDIEGRS